MAVRSLTPPPPPQLPTRAHISLLIYAHWPHLPDMVPTPQGFPVQFTHTNAEVVMAQCLHDPLCTEIIDARGDQVLHSVHIKIVPYPDDQIAVWLLLCVTYRSVL